MKQLEFRQLLIGSVKRQLRSDVPVGAALSGGIDSSTIVSIIKHLNPDYHLETFSFVSDNSSVSEEIWIDKLADEKNIEPNKLRITKDDFLKDHLDFILSAGEPLNSGPSYYAEFSVYKLAKRLGIKVLLDGHGADEMLCGYNGYPEYRIASLISERKFKEAISFCSNWYQYPDRTLKSSIGAMLKGTLISLSHKQSYDNSQLNLTGRYLASKLRDEVMIDNCPRQLRGTDRSAMFRSIENRVPFLSRDLVDFSLSLPEEFHIGSDGGSKRLLRRAMEGIVPEQILQRKDKIGYSAPVNYRFKLNDPDKFFEVSKNIYSFCPYKRLKTETKAGEVFVNVNNEKWNIYNLIQWIVHTDVSF